MSSVKVTDEKATVSVIKVKCADGFLEINACFVPTLDASSTTSKMHVYCSKSESADIVAKMHELLATESDEIRQITDTSNDTAVLEVNSMSIEHQVAWPQIDSDCGGTGSGKIADPCDEDIIPTITTNLNTKNDHDDGIEFVTVDSDILCLSSNETKPVIETKTDIEHDIEIKTEFEDEITIKAETDHESGLNSQSNRNNVCKTMTTIDIVEVAMSAFTQTLELIDDENEIEMYKNRPRKRRSLVAVEETKTEKPRKVATPRRLEGKEELGVLSANPIEYPFTCSVCGKMFMNQFFLVRHIKTDHQTATRDLRPYKCSQCGDSFGRMHVLGQHLLTHNTNNDRPFKCSGHCDSTFNTKRQLDQHFLKSCNVRPHNCDVCCKQFSSVGGLRDHMTVHTQAKPFLCQICGTSFKRNSQLKIHRNCHTGTIHQCTQCAKRFTTASSLRSHILTHDPNRTRYPCPICGVLLTRRSHINKHIQSVHRGSVTEHGEAKPVGDTFVLTSTQSGQVIFPLSGSGPVMYAELTPATVDNTDGAASVISNYSILAPNVVVDNTDNSAER